MPSPWNSSSGGPASANHDRVTLVEGSAFLVCDLGGEVAAERAAGLFFRDTRFVSSYSITVNGEEPESLARSVSEPYSATFISRSMPPAGRGDSDLLIERRRYIGRGMREDLLIRNFGEEPAYCALELTVGADFADLFAVKEGRTPHSPDVSVEELDGALLYRSRNGSRRRSLRVSFSAPAVLEGGMARWEVIIPSRESWSLCTQFSCGIDGDEIEPRWLCGQPVTRAAPAERMAAWRRSVPVVDTDHDGLRSVVARGSEDLGSLRIFDPDYPERTVVAAGAPWFMTLFGRDSLISAYMALLVDPELALGTLQTLARFQGEDVNASNEEEPGRILHEMRFGETSSLSLGGGLIYYGTADATPLFVMLLGELRRWGLAREAVDNLLPAADRAIDWMENFGDRDGDGYIEYQRASDRGLRHQGWKDSTGGIRFADGRLAEPPIALAEVQGYAYSAYLARAFFAAEQGDQALSVKLRNRAADLKAAFNRDFWIEDRGWVAMALDRDKKPVDALASNMGHCLWTGILDADKAGAVAKRLSGTEMFSGWGLRTLGSSMAGYNPVSYHCGSVWPHDTAIAAAGLMRYGFTKEAHRLIMGVIDAGAAQGGRLPELYSGLERIEHPLVVPYPTACSPQAWSAASPLLMLRTLLRLDPWVPRGKVWLHPTLPDQVKRLRVGGIPLAGARVTVTVEGDSVQVEGLPEGLDLVDAPRHPLTGT